MIPSILDGDSGVRDILENREQVEDFPKLIARKESDPMKLHRRILEKLDDYFLTRKLTYLFGQREMLAVAVEAVLQASLGTVTAIPFQPGIGKSTLIRALLIVMAQDFQQETPIAQTIGGVIVVVEKTAEAEELEALCNSSGETAVAKAISSPNDYNLAQGKCPNGTAKAYKDCLGRSCPDHGDCPLVRSAQQIHDTPILIMLHARYQRYMEDMSPFLVWYKGESAVHRSMLLVDELPGMFEEVSLCIATLNEAETELDQLVPSYRAEQHASKWNILCRWNTEVRIPFFKLSRLLDSRSGLVTEAMMDRAGFQQANLEQFQKKLMEYSENTKAGALISALLSSQSTYYSMDRTFTLFLPRLKLIDTGSQLSVSIFSGTAELSPEVTSNPPITVMYDATFEESYARLKIMVQRGDGFSASKTALANDQNRKGVLEWLRSLLPELTEQHRKILVVTYQSLAEWMWGQLSEYHDYLIPYIDGEGRPTGKLPYFGGLNGSNLYQEATCVVCVGLNRFEPREYLNRALALDPTGEAAWEIASAAEEGRTVRCDSLPGVRAMEHITLARDLVQLVFRSALRKHGEQEPIEFWLLHPPDAVLEHLKSYFKDCRIEVIPELPESCRLQAAISRRYMSEKTHAAKLLHWLESNQTQEFTSQDIRRETGLTLGQFKEAKKHPEVRRYFDDHIEATGSGRNTTYRRKQTRSPPVVA